ncbi:hypothetical protein QQO24_01765 [Ralstonia pseudosolanacearum]|uniref:hypothetical protein n=1 Tax=Ralstonia pseudosolanacearum TaxID=1310165 RepID=UPI0025B4762D|nr:hypothetical protein [Ralstonia pseudosolanacearum]MDN3365898.1 hypothetical protein [Ralstonia pseudosolanacearum]
MTKYTRKELLSALDWPVAFENENLREATLSLVPAYIVFDRFGWARHPERDGWFRWSTFGRDGDVAIAEARVESPAILVRQRGMPNTMIYNRAHLIAETCRLAAEGYGVTPHVDELIVLIAWLAAEATGHGDDEALVQSLICRAAEDASESAR